MIKCHECGKLEKELDDFLHYGEEEYICLGCDGSEYSVRCPHCERYIAVN